MCCGRRYSTYNVTSAILTNPGQHTHAVAVTLGNGFFNPLPLLFWGSVDIRIGLNTSAWEPQVKLDT